MGILSLTFWLSIFSVKDGKSNGTFNKEKASWHAMQAIGESFVSL